MVSRERSERSLGLAASPRLRENLLWLVAAKSPFYTEFLAAQGLKRLAGAMISPDPKVAVVPAADHEPAVVGQLGRRVENAPRLGIRLIDAEVAGLTQQEGLSRLGEIVAGDRIEIWVDALGPV